MSIHLPRAVKIGPIMFAVRKAKKIGKKIGTWGQIDYHKASIKIKGGLDVQHQAVSLMHEIFHGLFTAAGMTKIANDETAVEWMSEAMMDTLWNSPGLLRYLKETNKR